MSSLFNICYRIQQLEKLRENYQNNSQRIRDNYTLQVPYPSFKLEIN